MPQVEIIEEREDPSAWTFTVQVLDDAGTLRRHEVAVAWADYNLWSRSGTDEPAAVAAAVVRFMLSRLERAGDLPPTFDAAKARRLHPDADEVIPSLIG